MSQGKVSIYCGKSSVYIKTISIVLSERQGDWFSISGICVTPRPSVLLHAYGKVSAGLFTLLCSPLCLWTSVTESV